LKVEALVRSNNDKLCPFKSNVMVMAPRRR